MATHPMSKNARAFLIDAILNNAEESHHSSTSSSSSSHPLNLTVEPAPDIRCDLARPELWQQFATIGTEMIITKAGRRMFPTVQVQFSGEGINPTSHYLVVFEIVPASGKRFRYSYLQSSWTALDPATSGAGASSSNAKGGNYFSRRANASDFGREMCDNKLYVHPDCPTNGQILVSKLLSFERIKLTNNENLSRYSDHVLLKSMHQYEPRIHLIELMSSPSSSAATDNNSCNITMTKLQPDGSLFGADKALLPSANTVWTFNFPEARFMAVTAYQNQLITKLKIDNNPFAKGFRKISRFSVAQVHLAIGAAINATAASLASTTTHSIVADKKTQSSAEDHHQNLKRLQSNRSLTTSVGRPSASTSSSHTRRTSSAYWGKRGANK